MCKVKDVHVGKLQTKIWGDSPMASGKRQAFVKMLHHFSMIQILFSEADRAAVSVDHWLTAKKGVHQFRSFLSNMRTPKFMTRQGKYSL